MGTRVLIVERGYAQRSSYADTLKKRYDVLTASSGKEAVALGLDHHPRAVVLDAISMRTPGDRICQQLRQSLPEASLIHLHPGAKGKVESCADVILIQPFTARKLTNAIERLLKENVTPQSNEILACGPFVLNMARRVLTFNGHETALTPKLVQLVAIFLRHPGKTLDRKLLMEQVWDTAYMGDTRTLDVHIRWFRRAVEANPSKPVYLKTVRGIGYRLELGVEPESVALPEAQLELT